MPDLSTLTIPIRIERVGLLATLRDYAPAWRYLRREMRVPVCLLPRAAWVLAGRRVAFGRRKTVIGEQRYSLVPGRQRRARRCLRDLWHYFVLS
jgi:hypothetical protein